MLLSAVSVLVVAQSNSEVPEGLMNNPVYFYSSKFLERVWFKNVVVNVPSSAEEMLQNTTVQRRKSGHPTTELPSDRLVIIRGELTLNLPTTTIVAQPFNVIKWQLKFNPVA